MTNLFIECEGDIEHGIEYCTELAKMKGKTFITLAFPSKLMYNVFMENLHAKIMLMDDIPDDVDIQATVVLPMEDNDDEGFSYR
jgi:hypothetical protein